MNNEAVAYFREGFKLSKSSTKYYYFAKIDNLYHKLENAFDKINCNFLASVIFIIILSIPMFIPMTVTLITLESLEHPLSPILTMTYFGYYGYFYLWYYYSKTKYQLESINRMLYYEKNHLEEIQIWFLLCSVPKSEFSGVSPIMIIYKHTKKKIIPDTLIRIEEIDNDQSTQRLVGLLAKLKEKYGDYYLGVMDDLSYLPRNKEL